ncbi:MAG: hypothetical protein ACK4M0_02010 [Phreatobacter sp.]
MPPLPRLLRDRPARPWAGLVLAILALWTPSAGALSRDNRSLLRLMDEVCIVHHLTADAAVGRVRALHHDARDLGTRGGPSHERAVAIGASPPTLVTVAAPSPAARITECRISGRTDDLMELEAAACAKWPLGRLRGMPAGIRGFAVTITAGSRNLSLRLTTRAEAGSRAGTFVFEAEQVH